ncbi:MAG TPA: D-alanyl-D-alanine carboxypeptidase/D-alanyl-D-alanine-endopeptidase [Tepidisphaeraceae bacterium]|jgi:D-alanyl-D-alanine carboxypeptidase/D-alanyl-D-alanine-endopeptidase (penicillin-binding protein 4)
MIGLCLCATAFAADIPGGSAKRDSAEAQLAARLDAALHGLDASGAVFAARVVDLSDGRELYAHNVDRPMMPASNGKLANDASGLEHFGPRHRFMTYLAVDGDYLWLIGTGDPACGDPRIAIEHDEKPTTMLDRWADALRARGITHIRGKLYFDDGLFDDKWIAPTWFKGYLTDWYAAPVTALTFNDNCIDTMLFPSEPGQPARLDVVPPTTNVARIINHAVTGSGGEAVSIRRAANENVFTLDGVVVKQTVAESKPVTDPGAFFAGALRTNLASHGITIDGPTERAPRDLARRTWPALVGGPLKDLDQDEHTAAPDWRVVAVHATAMADVLGRINKNSQNLFAEAMCKMQGRDWNLAHGKDQPGSWAAGGEAVHDFLRRHGIDDSHYVLVDGSGLSRENRVTARLLTDLFAAMAKHPDAATFRNSLTICGQDGTLRKRMTDIAGRVRGKTGSIGGVRTLSGYATTDDGRTLALSILFNNAEEHEAQCEHLADDACRVLVQWPALGTSGRSPTTRPASPR